jgi:hypothetical protein
VDGWVDVLDEWKGFHPFLGGRGSGDRERQRGHRGAPYRDSTGAGERRVVPF